jgi:hypothetical protein
MRKPRADILPTSNDLTILPLDVTDSASVARAVECLSGDNLIQLNRL